MAAGIDNHSHAARHCHATNAGDMRGRLSSSLADADCIGCATDTFTANVDIVAAGGEVITGLKAQCDVVVAGRVAKERLKTVRSVEEAACAVKERLRTGGRVLEADGVAERITTNGRVVVADRVASNRNNPTAVLFWPVVSLMSAEPPTAVFALLSQICGHRASAACATAKQTKVNSANAG
jgi:hypothetical protein